MNDNNLNGVSNNTNNLGNNMPNGNQNLDTFDMPNNQNNNVAENNVYNSTTMNTESANSVENTMNNSYVSNPNNMNPNMMNMNNGMNTVPNNEQMNNQNISEVSNTNFTNNTVNNNFANNSNSMNTTTMNMNSGINTMNNNLSNDMNNFQNGNVNQNNFISPTMNSEKNDDSFNTTSNKSNKGLIIGIIVLIVLIIGGVVGFIVFNELNTPKTKFLRTMDKYLESNNIDNSAINIYELFKDGATVKIDSDLNIKSENVSIMLGKININFIDNPNTSTRYANISFDNNKDSVINFDSYLENNKLYFSMKDVFDKYYYTELEYIKIYDENVNKLKDNIIRSLNSYFTNDKFIPSKEDGYSKISVSLSDKDLNNLAVLILENLKNDDALNLFVDEEMNLEDIRKKIDDEINSIKENIEYQSEDKIYIYNIYSKGSALVKQEIIIDKIKLVIEGETSGNITLLNDENVVLTGSYDKDKLNLSVSDDDMNFDFSLTSSEDISKDKVDANYNIIIKIKSEEDEIEVSANVKLNINKENSIPKIDVSNAKNISDITNEETENIFNKLSEIPILEPYFNMFKGLGDAYYASESDYEIDNCSPGMNCQSSTIYKNTIDDSDFGI